MVEKYSRILTGDTKKQIQWSKGSPSAHKCVRIINWLMTKYDLSNIDKNAKSVSESESI